MRIFPDTLSLHGVGMVSALNIRTVQSLGHELGIQTTGPNSGNLQSEVRFLQQQSPELPVTTTALKSILDQISLLSGFCVTHDGTHDGLKIFGQGHDACGTLGRVAAGNHMQVLAKKAHTLITGIQGNAGGDASLTLRNICLVPDDASQAPTAVVYNATLPASPIIDEVYTIGIPNVAGFAFAPDSVQSVSLSTNIEVETLIDVADIYPGDVVIAKARPEIRIVTDDPTALQASNIPYGGSVCEHADTWIDFAARNPYGGIKPKDSGTNHIRITAHGFAYVNSHFSASGGKGTAEVVIECTEKPGVSNALVVNTSTNLE